MFDQSNNIGAVDVEMDGSAFEEKSFFKILGLSFFFSKTDWGSCIISIAKTDSKKIGALVHSMSPEVVLYFYKSVWPCME